ncbi:hypothetical protein ACFV85_00785 [Streptomyces niveus]|uniref:hypothetical protein n=1 Tax=Streptomyces niveus TaxID=193462 RepID=UPI00365E52CD
MTSPESVIVRCQDNAAVGVTFRDRFCFDADYRGWNGERSWRTPTMPTWRWGPSSGPAGTSG